MKNILIGFFLSVCGLACVHAAPAPPKCADARNQDVISHVSRGQKFDDVIAYLESANVPYFVSSRKGQSVSMQLIREKGYAAFGPLEVIIRSDDGGGVFSMPAATEMLTMEFDKNAVLKSENCITYKTGT